MSTRAWSRPMLICARLSRFPKRCSRPLSKPPKSKSKSSMSRTKSKINPPSQGNSGSGPAVGKYAKTNRKFRSTTDPDATLVRHSGLKSRLRYKTHRVVDDAHAVITAVETTTGAVDEASQLQGLIEAHEDTTDKESSDGHCRRPLWQR